MAARLTWWQKVLVVFVASRIVTAVIFAIFAAIFSGAVGDRIRIHLGLADLAHTATTARLMGALEADPSLRVTRIDATSLPDIRGIVRRGEVDVALVLRGDLAAAPAITTSSAGAAPPPDQPIVLVESPSRALVQSVFGAELLVVGRRLHRPPLAPRLGPVAHAALHHVTCPIAVIAHE